MAIIVTFADGRSLTWNGQDIETVNKLASELANGATFTVKTIQEGI